MKPRKIKHNNNILKWCGIGACILFGIFLGALWFYQDDLPPTSELRNYTLRTGSEVYDRNGRMIYLFAFEKRKLVSLKELPPHLVDALLATEDKRFYSHFGVDIISNVRAVLIDIKNMNFSQGASTITQQMARNMFLTLDKQVSRKMRELILAFRIEAAFTKDEILEIYFNKIFWGEQNHGIETASLYYFNKHARDLNLQESAMMVGMIQRPNYYDPIKHPERAKKRRDYVLQRMLDEHKITESEYMVAISSPVSPQKGTNYSRFASDYFIEHIRSYLENKYGTDRLFEGGLRIYTTLDPDLSAYADSILNTYLTNTERGNGFPVKLSSIPKNTQDIETKYIQGGLVLMENKTGYVRALIGGRNFDHSKFNRMTQAQRQPGSSIKPIYYTMAVDRGFTPATVINDAPVTLGNWTPHNFDKSFHGMTRMRVALQWSYNVWAAKCADDIGINVISDGFNKFGLMHIDPRSRRPVPLRSAVDLTAALGSHDVIPISLISGYTTFPNEGVRVTPIFLTKVEDIKGNVLERARIQRYNVCSPQVAYIMTSMLQTVASAGTGGSSRNGYIWQNAGKTGTSDNYNDSWFIGFNKTYTLGIWTGFDNPSAKFGTALAARIWGPIMSKAIRLDNRGRTPSEDDPRYNFAVPVGIIHQGINPRTGFSVEQGGLDEVFIEGTVPPVGRDTLQFNLVNRTE
jgi:penicillin-binding protein 1A